MTETQVAPVKKQKKLKPARKQVKPGDVEKKEAPQSGKEYSEFGRSVTRGAYADIPLVERHMVQQVGWGR